MDEGSAVGEHEGELEGQEMMRPARRLGEARQVEGQGGEDRSQAVTVASTRAR